MQSQPETAPRTIHQEVRRFMAQVFFVDAFGDDASFLEEGIIDSTGMLELVLFLETTYAISIDHDELIPENLDTLNNVAAYIKRKTRG